MQDIERVRHEDSLELPSRFGLSKLTCDGYWDALDEYSSLVLLNPWGGVLPKELAKGSLVFFLVRAHLGSDLIKTVIKKLALDVFVTTVMLRVVQYPDTLLVDLAKLILSEVHQRLQDCCKEMVLSDQFCADGLLLMVRDGQAVAARSGRGQVTLRRADHNFNFFETLDPALSVNVLPINEVPKAGGLGGAAALSADVVSVGLDPEDCLLVAGDPFWRATNIDLIKPDCEDSILQVWVGPRVCWLE